VGASSWIYFTAWRDDPREALQELQADEIRRTAGVRKRTTSQASSALKNAERLLATSPHLPPEVRRAIEGTIENLKRLAAPEPEPEDAGDEGGSHSILDVIAVGEKLDVLVATPVSDADLVRLFGTTKPTHAQVEEKRFPLMTLRKPQHPCFLSVFEGEEPVEYCFAGATGD
jgi:hypothetical protein